VPRGENATPLTLDTPAACAFSVLVLASAVVVDPAAPSSTLFFTRKVLMSVEVPEPDSAPMTNRLPLSSKAMSPLPTAAPVGVVMYPTNAVALVEGV
jgi:hypothetical protein